MTAFDSRGSVTHPFGWPFLGAGSIGWLWPVLRLRGIDPKTWLQTHDVALTLVVVVFLASILAIVFEFLMILVERFLLWATRLERRNPCRDAWLHAWRSRWEWSPADTELRRYEGTVSVARMYATHSALAGVFWWVYLSGSRAVAVLAISFAMALLFVLMWRHGTKKIFDLVRVSKEIRGLRQG